MLKLSLIGRCDDLAKLALHMCHFGSKCTLSWEKNVTTPPTMTETVERYDDIQACCRPQVIGTVYLFLEPRLNHRSNMVQRSFSPT